MARTFDIECDHCGTLVRVVIVGYGEDERKCLDCPQCKRLLFSWQDGMVCDIEKILRTEGK